MMKKTSTRVRTLLLLLFVTTAPSTTSAAHAIPPAAPVHCPECSCAAANGFANYVAPEPNCAEGGGDGASEAAASPSAEVGLCTS
jgi:hypothetical protein